MLKQPIYVEFNLDAKVNSSKLIAISHVDDKYSETLEVAVKQNDRFVYMGGADVVARMVLHRDKDYLLSDNVACSVNDNGNIMIPFDNAVVKTSHGVVKIEVSITRGEDELTLQFPLWVSVNGSILETAEVTPDSEGTIPDLLREVRDLLAEAATPDDVFEILDSTLSGNPNVAPTLLIDSTVDQQYNPFGHLMVYYVDSNDVRHNLYDFSSYLESVKLYGGTLYENAAPADGNVNLYLFGGGANSLYKTGLAGLTSADYGKVWHIKLKFDSASLNSANSVTIQEVRGTVVSAYRTFSAVKTGDVIDFDYSMTAAGNTILRVRLNEVSGGAQNIRATVFLDVKSLLDEKANLSDVPTKTSDLTNDSNFITSDEATAMLDRRTGTIEYEETLFGPEELILDRVSTDAADGDVRYYLTSYAGGAELNLEAGHAYKIFLRCEEVDLAGTKAIRLYHRVNDTVVEVAYRDDVVSSDTPVAFEYTKPTDVSTANLYLRFNCKAGVQRVYLTVTTLRTKTMSDSDALPDYCLDEIERVKKEVLNITNYGDIVFGLFTDLHFGNPGRNASDDTQKWNAIKSMRRLADECVLDFILQGGDLLTKGTYINDAFILNRSQYEFAGGRAPLYTSKGDHDSNQTDTNISKSDFAKRTAPYMPKAVRSAEYPNNYYFDLPEKKTRVINIDTGTMMAGQSGRGADYTSWTNEQLFNWLLDEVLTEDVKNGWRFIIFTHAPCDYEWQFGMTKKFRAEHPDDTENSQNAAKGKMLILNDLLDAINGAGNFTTEKTSKHYELVHDSNGVLQEANETADALGGDVYSISGIETTNHMPFVKTKNFSGWTSKVRLILSGHCHCDRLNTSTLIPDGNGNYVRGNTSYAIAYTASAAKAGFKSTQIPANSGKTYYNYCFGNNALDEHPGESAANAAWSHIQNRSYGEISEQLFDIWIVGGTYVERVRFGAGAGSELLADNITIPTFTYDGGHADIAAMVLAQLPTTEGVQYGN